MVDYIRPSAPVVHSSDVEHRRQLANIINLVSATTPDNSRSPAEISAQVLPVNFRYAKSPERYGAKGDGVTDDTEALKAWASVSDVRTLLARTYKCNDRLTFARNAVVIGSGSGLSKIDFSGATGPFSGNRAMDFSQGSFAGMADLAGSVTAGESEIEFDGAHGLVQGDVFAINDPSSGSWSGHLSSYTKGEFCTVAQVVNSTTVRLAEPLYDSYTAGTNCLKFNYGTVYMTGVGIIGVGSGSSVTTLFASHIAHSRFRDVVVYGGGARASDIRFAYDIDFNGASYQFVSDSPGTAQYGLVISHCQDMRVEGTFQAQRHAVTTGATGGNGGVVNRGIIVIGNLKSLTRAALDFHGNTEWSSFNGGVINGMVAIGGDNNAVRNAHILGSSEIEAGSIIRLRECLGFNFEFSNILGKTLANPFDTGGTGVIDAGGNNSTTITASTTRSGTCRFSNVQIDAPNAPGCIRMVNRGSSADLDILVNGFVPRLSGSTDTTWGYIRLDNLSGGNFRSLKVEGMSNPDSYPESSTLDVDTVL